MAVLTALKYCCYAIWRWHRVESSVSGATLNGDFLRIELQIEPSMQLVGINRSSTLKPRQLVWASFQR